MPSIINTDNIDIGFPVAGQDNDSQGFRDNFTNIRDILDTASEEITALQEDVEVLQELVVDTPPTSAIGALGDIKGMMAYDVTYMYLCTADYDGATSIWVRSAITAW